MRFAFFRLSDTVTILNGRATCVYVLSTFYANWPGVTISRGVGAPASRVESTEHQQQIQMTDGQIYHPPVCVERIFYDHADR
jgi:hypothetical protein